MAQAKFNIQLIKQVISFILTAGNILLQCIETIERNLSNV